MPEAAAGRADLPEHRGERDDHPERLLAVVRALQRPARVDERAARGHAARERPQALRLDAGDGARPLGTLGDAVGLAHADRAGSARSRRSVFARKARSCRFSVTSTCASASITAVSVFGRIGIHSAPGTSPRSWRTGLTLTKATPARARLQQAGTRVVLRDAARVDLHVLRGHAAERDEELAVLLERRPRGVPRAQLVYAAQHVRQQRAARAEAVARHVAHVAADRVHEAMHLALRVVEAPGAPPAVRAREDRLVAVRGLHPLQLRRDEIERLVPGHFDERLGAAPFGARAGAAVRASSCVSRGAGCGRAK